MGTPDFAVPSLRILVEAGYDIVAVVTAPDKPAGRGLQMQVSPVKAYALSRNIPVLQPEKLKDAAFLEQLQSLNANLQVVVAFRMLPEAAWNMPSFGTFNLHASLLPDYRGAAPINWAVINGETETGATTFFLKHEIDTGDIIMQQKMEIGPDEDAGSVHDRLMLLGADLVLKTVNAIAQGTVATHPQEIKDIPKPAPKIFKQDCRIDWNGKDINQLHNFIRGLSPYPGAWTMLDGKVLKIYRSSKELDGIAGKPGKIITDQKSFLKIICLGGFLNLLEIQIEGRKKMGVEEFLRGYHGNLDELV
jgi:methionyl-tRNA formyltransferase